MDRLHPPWASILLLCLILTTIVTTSCKSEMSALAILTKDTKIEIGPRGKDEERMKRLEDKLDQIKDQVSRLEQAM